MEHSHEKLVLNDSTSKDVWNKILEAVAYGRKKSEMLQLFPLKEEDLFDLSVSVVARMTESLPEVEHVKTTPSDVVEILSWNFLLSLTPQVLPVQNLKRVCITRGLTP